MWYFKWLLLLVYVIHAESTVYDNRRFHTAAINRHKHHRELSQLMPSVQIEHATNNNKHFKLRHHGSSITSHSNAGNANSLSLSSRHDKFPMLGKIDKRLESIQRASSSARTKNTHWRQHEEAPDKDPMDTIDDFNDDYDDDEDDDDVTASPLETTQKPVEDDDDSMDEEMNEDDYADEIVEEAPIRPHDIQAEESAREPSDLTVYKWQKYGTRAKVEESRLHHEHGMRDNEHARLGVASTIQHIMRIKSQGKCKLPRPKVISVQELHPAPSKGYRPHCTVLHRCGDDTGCCHDEGDGMHCRPKTQELIYLYFYSTTYNPVMTRVEKLSFYNHTECRCLPDDFEPEVTSQRLIRPKQGHFSHHNSNNIPHDNTNSCKCSEEFVLVNHRFGPRFASKCMCDCPLDSESQSGCMNQKRGSEHFSMKDRKCINNGRCVVPNCEYGNYINLKGRCPREDE